MVAPGQRWKPKEILRIRYGWMPIMVIEARTDGMALVRTAISGDTRVVPIKWIERYMELVKDGPQENEGTEASS